MKRLIIGAALLVISLLVVFYANSSVFYQITLHPQDSQNIKLNFPLEIVKIKDVTNNIHFLIVNGSISKIINETNERIFIIFLNTTKGQLILVNNSSNTTVIKYSVETLNTQQFLLFFASIIIFIVGIVVILTEIRKKK